MPNDNKPDFSNIDWEKMFGENFKNKIQKNGSNQKKSVTDTFGWLKVVGDSDIKSSGAESVTVEAAGDQKSYFARMLSPVTIITKTEKTAVKPEQRFEIGFSASTNSSSGFLAATATFINESGTPMGVPSSVGVKLNTLNNSSPSPVSFITGPAPEGAKGTQLALCVFGVELEKYVDINQVSIKEIP